MHDRGRSEGDDLCTILGHAASHGRRKGGVPEWAALRHEAALGTLVSVATQPVAHAGARGGGTAVPLVMVWVVTLAGRPAAREVCQARQRRDRLHEVGKVDH